MRIEHEILAISEAWDTALVANHAPAIAAFMATSGCSWRPTG
jgi:hypothetical protein